MDERNNQQNYEPGERHSYGNGSTQPPKSHGGLIAVILCSAIFLCGLMSLLGMWKNRATADNDATGGVNFNNTSADATQETSASTGAPAIPNPDSDVQMNLSPFPGQVENIQQPGGLGLQEIYQRNIPSVVSIICTLKGGTSTGTGVVLTKDGYIVTNAHVVSGAQSIQVLLTDGRNLPARLAGADGLSDLAVLYVQASDLTPAQFGDSAQLRVGDAVVAIGDPLGVELRGTMTDGIVSAINRDVQTGGRTMTLIQTNAALNSGNSGGPLINCHGQVIGINTMKIGAFADDAGVEGLGFAIPSATAKEIVEQLISQGYVSDRPALNLAGEWVSAFNQQFRRMPAGFYVTDAPADSPVTERDIILSLDGVRITEESELNQVLYAHKAGDVLSAVIYRNGRQYSVELTLTEAGR